MKRIILIFIAIHWYQLSFTQTNSIELGFELGPSLASLRGNTTLDQNSSARLGYGGGFAIQYNINSLFSLRAVPGIERKGSIEHLQLTNQVGVVEGEVFVSHHLDYLTLPVLFRVSLGNTVKAFFNAGPYAAYLFHTAAGLSVVESDPKFSTDKALLQSFDYGLSGGAGICLPIGERFSCSFELRNNLGLVNISKTPVIGNGSIKTNSTCLLFACAYRL